jgi:hypothetical protein
VLWQSNGQITDNAWTFQSFNVTAYKNQFFRIRFGFSVASGAPVVSSWNIDHVRLGRTGQPNCG